MLRRVLLLNVDRVALRQLRLIVVMRRMIRRVNCRQLLVREISSVLRFRLMTRLILLSTVVVGRRLDGGVDMLNRVMLIATLYGRRWMGGVVIVRVIGML